MDSVILTEIGLTKKESQVYLALLEIGSSSATEIIRKTGFHRAVVYDLLERLIEKGLVGYVIKGRKKFYESADPNRLLEILHEKENKINSLIPKLKELFTFKENLEVKIYKGKEGIKTIFEDIIRNSPEEWLSLGSGSETYLLMPSFLDDFHKRRIKNKIKVRGLLLNKSKTKLRAKKLDSMKLTEIKFLPKSFLTPTVINIYGERCTLYSVTEDKIPFIILIDNKQLTKSFKKYFEWLWKISTKI